MRHAQKMKQRTSDHDMSVLLSCRLVKRSKPGSEDGEVTRAKRLELRGAACQYAAESENDVKQTNLSARLRSLGSTAAIRSTSSSVGRSEKLRFRTSRSTETNAAVSATNAIMEPCWPCCGRKVQAAKRAARTLQFPAKTSQLVLFDRVPHFYPSRGTTDALPLESDFPQPTQLPEPFAHPVIQDDLDLEIAVGREALRGGGQVGLSRGVK